LPRRSTIAAAAESAISPGHPSLPFEDASFDLVVSFDVVSHVREAGERRASLAEFRRVLRPGGGCLVRVAAFEWLRTSHDDQNLTHRRFGAAELREGLVAAGFQEVRLTFANALLFPAAVVWRLLKRAGIAPQGSDVRNTTRGPDWLNGSLSRLLLLEAAFLRRPRAVLPFGLSLIATARRPPS
jgi:SAM-dependent methyltransferase